MVAKTWCRLFNWPFRNIVPHIASHDLPCHKTKRLFREITPNQVFELLQQRSAIRTFFCVRQPYLRLVYIRVECIPSTRDQGTM